MADCRKCKHNYKPPTCEPKCNRMCDGESDFESITNADCIRGMSDEELEEFIVDINRHCLAGLGKVDCSAYKYCEGNCEKVVSKWLQAEVEG